MEIYQIHLFWKEGPDRDVVFTSVDKADPVLMASANKNGPCLWMIYCELSQIQHKLDLYVWK